MWMLLYLASYLLFLVRNLCVGKTYHEVHAWPISKLLLWKYVEAKAVPVRISGGLSHVGYNQNCCLIDLLVLHPSLLVFFFLNFSCETLIRTLLFLGLQLQYSRTGKGWSVMFFFYFRKAGKNLLKPNSFFKKILKPMGIRPSIDKNYSMVLNFNPYPICFLPYVSRKNLFFFFFFFW